MIDIAAALKKYLDALGETPPKKKQLVSAIMDEQVAPWQVSWFKTAADATDIMDFIASIKAEQADNFRAHSMAHEIKQQTNLDGEIIVGWIFEGCGVDNPFGRASDPTAPETVLGQQVRFPQQVASETKLALSDGEVYEGEVRDG
ncbi:MAG: hypothetical protein FWH55_11720, partial [Oscillospiraceae bacterium]|nr:hypothetical protein [Oscillospiraceae bacterium]